MRIRRVLATAAATAVIAPAALMAAPAAYANEHDTTVTTADSPSPGNTETTEPAAGDEPGDPVQEAGDDQAPAEDEKPAEDESTEGENADSGTAPAEGGNAAEGETAGDGEKPGEEDGEKPGEEEGETPESGEDPATEPGEGEEEPEFPLFCEEVDENYTQAVTAELSGLPGKVVAGSGWHGFKLTVTNTSEKSLKEVAFYAEIENYQMDEDKYLSRFVQLQFRVPGTNEWMAIGDKEWAGAYFWGVEEMKAKDYVAIDLRVNINKNAPAGHGYTFGSGAFLDNVEGQECIAEGWDDYEFTVVKPGTKVPDPGEAKPKPGDESKPGTGTGPKPQGGIEKQPVTGNLAETGSSSALPTIALIGGVAMAAGAGAVFVVRRRRTGDMGATA
ncbi:LPXTG cell wall anchor domain-containing protein [Streptomyces sp. F63]|uniref:LAETG motif-containing sortase-dependent surface protein n=1 Tax=Streptomyces sp. F63 TaxID=2824887 RepID=UPI001B38F492|nr:LAETG motif-containing sortase-dependent surface protein [Streptomyces sp. F63]MBQ0986034.1 LPXTG cell wall anchor domain-containing protein [Streptomyces sp. F63]